MQGNNFYIADLNANIVNMIEGFNVARYGSVDEAIKCLTELKNVNALINPDSSLVDEISQVLILLGKEFQLDIDIE